MTPSLTSLAAEHKIAAIEISHHRLPLDPPFRASWDTKPRVHFDATVVRVRTDTGLEGVGSGDLMVGFAGHENLFIGRDPLAIERHYRVLSHIDFHYGRCWPLDLALWDLAGKITGQPCWKLLGGLSRKVRAYASSGTLRTPTETADVAERMLSEGFPALKLRFHRGDWRDDIRALEAVRARLGDKIDLMVDCNQGWRMAWDTQAPWSYKDAIVVLKVGARDASDVPTLAEARDEVSQRVYAEQLDRARRQWLDELRKGLYVDVRL